MERNQRDEGLQPGQHRLVDHHRRREGGAPVHHPVAHAGEPRVAEPAAHQREQLRQRGRVTEVG